MKSWGWLLLFILAVLASVYLWKKPAATNVGAPQTNPMMVPSGTPNSVGPFGVRPPSQGLPTARPENNFRPNEGYSPDSLAPTPVPPDPMGQAPRIDQNNEGNPPGYIPPPPPIAPFPEGDQPEYFDGDGVPPPFEPPTPLEESGGFIPPPPSPEPEAGE
ncbi:MAG: hypothetical protein EBQ92_05040 [Proteobacteria bacterium]|nr:hypothetical protein [Pseudomonadota bacterium]